MLQLVRKVCDADSTIDLREDHYMVALALALSLSPLNYGNLVVRESRGINGPLKRIEDIVLGSLALAAVRRADAVRGARDQAELGAARCSSGSAATAAAAKRSPCSSSAPCACSRTARR